jgi:excisionase family DNA binding protein
MGFLSSASGKTCGKLRNKTRTRMGEFPQIGPRKMQTEFEPLITSEKAAELLGIHLKTLQRMARSGRIPAVRIGKFWRFRKSDLDSWVRANVNCSGYAYRSEQDTV